MYDCKLIRGSPFHVNYLLFEFNKPALPATIFLVNYLI